MSNNQRPQIARSPINKARQKKNHSNSQHVNRSLVAMAGHAENNGQKERKERSPLGGELSKGVAHAGQFLEKSVEDHCGNQARPTEMNAVRREMLCLGRKE